MKCRNRANIHGSFLLLTSAPSKFATVCILAFITVFIMVFFLSSVGFLLAGVFITKSVDFCVHLNLATTTTVTCRISKKLKQLNADEIYVLSEYHIVKHKLKKLIMSSLHQTPGLYVLGGPSGSGKSAMMTLAVREFRLKHPTRNVATFSSISALNDQIIYKALNAPEYEPLSRYIPAGTVLVIDQVDVDLSTFKQMNIQSNLMALAMDSYNSKKFHIILVVSNPQVMRHLLEMNGGQKILDVCSPTELRWSGEQIREYIEENMDNWPQIDRDALFEGTVECSQPGLLSTIGSRSQRGAPTDSPIPPAACVAWGKQQAIKQKNIWDEFDRTLGEIGYEGFCLP